MRGAFNAGRAARDGSMMDLGSVHERSAAIFTVYLAQYAPAAVYGEEDRLLTSKLTFVDMPGAMRLTADVDSILLNSVLCVSVILLSKLTVVGRPGEATQLIGRAITFVMDWMCIGAEQRLSCLASKVQRVTSRPKRAGVQRTT